MDASKLSDVMTRVKEKRIAYETTWDQWDYMDLKSLENRYASLVMLTECHILDPIQQQGYAWREIQHVVSLLHVTKRTVGYSDNFIFI